MMMTLLVLKSKIKNIYEKHYLLARGAIKFCLLLVSLLLLRGEMNYFEPLNNNWLVIGLALLCAITPDVISNITVISVIGMEIFQISTMMTVCFGVSLVVYLLLFSKMEKRQCEVILALPILSLIKMGYLVPLVAALFVSPIMLPAIFLGLVLQYGIEGANSYMLAQTGNLDEGQVLNSLHYLIDYILQNKEFWVILAAYIVSFVCIYFVRKGKYKGASQIGILVGSILFLTVTLICNILMELQMDILPFTLRVLVAMAIAYIVQFFRMTLDYHGTQKLQFEDDEYYYYVTAVPKFKVAVVDKTVTRIVSEEEEDIPTDLRSELEKAIEEEMSEKENIDE
ncbi:MAG: hypothetical protein K6G62_04005 [Eubacterium sp.]|nr:hypothetical protein [Eubacterium sp.]